MGDVTLPVATPSSIVVFVEGSGPGGRDQGSWPERLASRGIASLAYDKPGSGASTGDWTTQTIEDRADETVEAVLHAAHLGFDDIAVVGASQGGWVARLAATRTDVVHSVVTASGPAVGVAAQERFRLRSQLGAEGLGAEAIERALSVFDRRVERLEAGHSGEEVWAEEVGHRDEPWYRHLAGTTPSEIDFVGRILAHDPLPPLRALRQPLLSVFGSDDLLVDVPESVEIIRRERPDGDRSPIVVVPGADHSLRQYTGSGSPQFTDGHHQPGALTPGVVEQIGDWLREQS